MSARGLSPSASPQPGGPGLAGAGGVGATLGPSPPAKLVELSRGAATRPAAAPGVGLGPICTPFSLRRCPLAGCGIPGPDGAARDPRGARTSTQARGSCEPRSAPCGRREGAPSGGPGRRRRRAPGRRIPLRFLPARFTGLELGPRRAGTAPGARWFPAA